MKGDLSPAHLADKRFIRLHPVVSAIVYLKEKGKEPPFNPVDVYKIAEKKFNANATTLGILEQVSELNVDSVVLDVVKEKLLMEKLFEDLSRQMSEGKFNPTQIEGYLDTAKQGATPYVYSLEKPTGPGMIEFITRSGIRALDNIIGGFGSELWIVSARVKTGKSHFLLNIAARQPQNIKVLYVTVADYGYHELNWILNTIDPKIHSIKQKSVRIADLTSFSASLFEVEKAIKAHEPKLCIVDRAEKLRPSRNYGDQWRMGVGEIYETLRQYAKKYNCSMLVDAQYSSEGANYLRSNKGMSSEFMSEDKTQRQAVMDGWVGLQRIMTDEDGHKANGWRLYLEGRRPGKLPDVVEVYTNPLGVITEGRYKE